MDSRGHLYQLDDEQRQFMERCTNSPLIPLTEKEYMELEPMRRPQRKNYMRNKPCLCGSGKVGHE